MERGVLLKCDLCGQSFGAKSQLYRHLATHTGDENASFTTIPLAKVRDKTAQAVEPVSDNLDGSPVTKLVPNATLPPYECDVCGSPFQTKLRLRIHQNSHAPNLATVDRDSTGDALPDSTIRSSCTKPLIVGAFKKKLGRPRLPQQKTKGSDITADGGEPTKVNTPDYGNRSADEEEVGSERTEASPAPSDRSPAADAGSLSRLLATRRAHLADVGHHHHTCQVCGKTFKNKFYLKKHAAKHLERAFICAVCGKEVGDERELQKHEVTHSRRKDFKCQFCDKAFTVEQHMVLHQNLYHKLLAKGLGHGDSGEESDNDGVDSVDKEHATPLSKTHIDKLGIRKRSAPIKHMKLGVGFAGIKRRPGRPPKFMTQLNSAPKNFAPVPAAQNGSHPPPAPITTPINGFDDHGMIPAVSDTLSASPDFDADGSFGANHMDLMRYHHPTVDSKCEVCEASLRDDAVSRKLHSRFHRYIPKGSALYRHTAKAAANTTSGAGSLPNKMAGPNNAAKGKDLDDLYPEPSATNLLRSNLDNLSAIQPHILNSIFDSSFWAFNKMDESNLFCLYCDIRFDNINDLKTHYFTHLASPRFQCDTCGETFDTKVRLQDHIILHQLDVTFMCNLCSRVFSSQEQLKAHELSHHNLELMARVANLTGGRCLLYTCNVCGKNFDRQEKYEIHYQLYHSSGGPFQCAFCHLDFDQKILLLKHLKRYHKDIYKPSKFRCIACRLSFPNEYLLREHEFTHEDIKRFSCQVCGSLFRQIYNVNNHIRKCHFEIRGVEYIVQRNEIMQNESLFFATETEFLHSALHLYPVENNYANELRRNVDLFAEPDDDNDRITVKEESDADSVVFGDPDTGFDDLAELYEVWQCATCGECFDNAYDFARHVATNSTNTTSSFDPSSPSPNCSEETYECPRCFFVTKDAPIFNAHFHTDFHFHQQNNFLLYNSLRLLPPTVPTPFQRSTKPSLPMSCSGEYEHLVEHLMALRPGDRKSQEDDASAVKQPPAAPLVLRCETCDSHFTNKSNYGRHIVLHNTVVPYECYLCGQAFVVIENMKKHYLVHFYTLKSAHFSSHHCISCNGQFDSKIEFQEHVCTEEPSEKNYKCVDCKHSFLTRDLFIGHVCLGNSLNYPQYPMLSDYGIEAASTQILSNYIPISQSLPIKDIIPYPMTSQSGKPSSANHSSVPSDQTHPFEFVYRGTMDTLGGGAVIDEQGLEGSGTMASTLSFMRNMSLELPDQLKFSAFMDPSKRPISSENPWEEYWPKEETVPGHTCSLAVCQREYRMYEAIFTVKPARLPLIHLRSCDVTKVYCCEGCDHSFRERKILDEHIITIHFNNLPPHYFLCNICGKFSRAGRSFKVHLERHYAENKFLCDQCAMAFPSKSQLKSHYQSHAGGLAKLLKCPICSKEFGQRTELNYHMYNHTGLKPYVCNVCSKSYVKRTKLLEHMKSHTGERPYKCYSCGEAFPHRKFLQEHIATAHGNQTFKCPQCDKTFSYEPHLIRHAKIHSGHNPYTCHICDKDFFRKEKLQRHLFVHDSNTLYKCDVCHKGYSTREVLEKHICVREKGCENIVFKCPLCPRKFTFKKNLELHIAHHQPNEVRNDRKKVAKQYYCNLCPKAFVHLKKLNRHLIFHQKYPNFEGGIPIIVEEKKFKCHLCPKTFIKNFYLKKHLENHFKYSGSRRMRTTPNTALSMSTGHPGSSMATMHYDHSTVGGGAFNSLSAQGAAMNLITSNPMYLNMGSGNGMLQNSDSIGGSGGGVQVSWAPMPDSYLLNTAGSMMADGPGPSNLYYHGHHDGPGGVDGLNSLELPMSYGNNVVVGGSNSAASVPYMMLSDFGSSAGADNSAHVSLMGGNGGVGGGGGYFNMGVVDGMDDDVVNAGGLPFHPSVGGGSGGGLNLMRPRDMGASALADGVGGGLSVDNNSIMNALDNNMYTFVQIQDDGTLAPTSGSLEDNQALYKVIEQLQEDGTDGHNLIIIQTDN